MAYGQNASSSDALTLILIKFLAHFLAQIMVPVPILTIKRNELDAVINTRALLTTTIKNGGVPLCRQKKTCKIPLITFHGIQSYSR